MQKQKIITIILSFCITALLTVCCFAPGIHIYAEWYTINITSDKVIAAIKQKKKEDSTLTPKEIINALGEIEKVGIEYIDGRTFGLYTYFDFYIETNNELYRILVRDSIQDKITYETYIGLESVCRGNDLRTSRFINKDFKEKENEEKKSFFEENILKDIILRAKKM